MSMRQVPCIWALAQKISQFYITYYIEITCPLYGHMERTEIVNQSSCKVGDPGKDLESRVCCKTCFVIEDFGSNRNGYSYRKMHGGLLVLKVRRDFYFWTDL